MPKKLKLNDSMKPTRPSRINTKKKDVLYIIGDWNAKVGSQEIPGLTVKFGLGIHKEAEQRLTVLLKELSNHRKLPLLTTQEMTLYMDSNRGSTPKSD